MVSKFFLSYILLICATSAIAQQQRFFDHHTTFNTGNNGLIDNHVYASCMDKDGNLWFGTSSGISSYNGKNWLSFHDFNSNLQADTIFSLADDGSLIWAGTDNGTWTFDGQAWKTFPENHLLSKVRVLDILVDSHNRIWFGLKGLTSSTNDHTGENSSPSLVLMKDGNRWNSFSEIDGITGQIIHSVYEDRYGNIWLATDGGACKFNGQMWIPYTTQNGLPCDHIVDVLQDSTKKMWFATCNSGVVSYDWVNWQQLPLNESDNDSIMTLFLDNKQQLWAGTRAGYARFQEGEWEKLKPKKGFRVESHSGTMLEDRSGNMWFASSSGLMAVSSNSEQYFNTFDGLASNSVKNISIDKNGGNWLVTTELAVGYEKEGVWKNFEVEASETDHIESIFITKNYGKWAVGSKVWELEKDTFTPSNISGVLPKEGKIQYIWENEEQQLCVAIRSEPEASFQSFAQTDGGWIEIDALLGHKIHKVIAHTASASSEADGNTLSTDAVTPSHLYYLTQTGQNWTLLQSSKEGFEEIPLPSFAENLIVNAAIETETEKILLATNQGIMVYEQDTWNQINTADGLVHDFVSDVALDKVGNIWAVYGQAGKASMFDGEEWLHFDERHGLPNSPITQVSSFNRKDQTVQPFLLFASKGAGVCKLPQPDLHVATQAFELDKQKQTITIPIESNVGWQVSSSVSWLVPRIVQGEGSLEVTVDVETNNSSVIRKGTISISTGILKNTLEVSQHGQESILLLEDNTLSFEATGGVKSTNLFTNTDATFTVSDESWIEVALEPKKSKTVVHVEVAACNSCSREGEITFKGGGAERTLKIFQGHVITGLPQDESIVVEAYPNPASEVLYLTGQFDAYKVFDLLGNAVRMGSNVEIDRPISIDLTNMAKGLYLINTVKEGGQKTIKVLVE